MALKTWSTGRKIALLGVVCALAAGGGAFAAAAPGLAQCRDFLRGRVRRHGRRRDSPSRWSPRAELAVSPADGAKQVNPAAPVSLKVTQRPDRPRGPDER